MLLVSPLAAAGVVSTPASAATSPTFHVTQSGQCYEVTPVGDGTESAEEFYDYRAGTGTKYGSYGAGSQAIQENQVSHLFLYRGSQGLSLVMLHDDLNQSEGGAITFDIAGLPSEREWVIEDDDYPNRDDNFDHGATSSTIDWMWADERTDGAVVRGLDADFDAITIDPAFGEQSWAYQERSTPWPYATDDLSWELQSGDGTEISLDKSQQVSVSKGGCPDTTAPNADLSISPSTVDAGEQVSLDASGSSDDQSISEYRWDFDGDGSVDETTSSSTITHNYANAGSYDATVTVADGGGNTDSDTVTVTVEEDGDTTPPTTRADVPENVTAGESFEVNASESTDDVGIEQYRWDFDGAVLKGGETVSHTFSQPGTYDVTLTVIDAAGNSDNVTETVTVESADNSDTTPPVAKAWANPETAETGEDIDFVGENSTDNVGIVDYTWEFDDGTTMSGSDVYVMHSFDTAGEHTATLTVTDAAGNNDSTTVTVTVEQADVTDPEAVISASPQTVNVGEDVTFDASESTDDESIEAYQWDFDSDGVTDETTDGPTIMHSFDSVGEHEVTVVVSDGRNFDSATTNVTVEEAETDTPPTAKIDAPDRAFRDEGALFSASNSTDDNGIVSYEWEFENGETATGEEVYHYFGSTGERTATLTVTDTAGNTDTATATVDVREEDSNSPNAELTASKTTVEVGESVEFNASGSTDEESGIEFYHWNFDGDQAFEETTESPTNSHAFSAPGEYQVEVMVEDNGSNALTDTASVNVTVQEDSDEPIDTAPPTAKIDVPATVTVGEQFTASGSGSTDDNGIVSYEWQFDDGTTKTGETVTHSYDHASEHTVTLTVTDAAGKTDTASETFTVEESESEPPTTGPPKDAAPTAALSAPDSTPLSETLHLDGSGSTDDEDVVAYKWDFDSDGTYEHTYTDQSDIWVRTWAVYGSAGTYDVTLTVVDEKGQTDSVTKSITVEKRDHTKPTATIDAPETVTVGEQFELRATDFSEDDLEHICWVFSADGHGEEHGPEGETATWSFDSTGEKTVQVMLRDRAGNQQTIETTITVVADSGDDPEEPTDPSDPAPTDPNDPDEGGLDDEPPRGSTGGSLPSASPSSSSNNDAPNSPITASFGDGLGTVSLKAGSSDVSVAANATVPQNIREPTATQDGFDALSYLQISGDAKRATFTVDQDRLAAVDASVDDVSFFHFENGSWSTVKVEQLKTKGDAYRFRTNGSVSGTYAVGLDAPAISVTDLSLAETRIDAADSTELTVTLSNAGRANGTFEATLTVGGKAVAAKPVSVPAGETRDVTFDVSADSPGVYTVGVGDATTSLTIAGIQTETTAETTMRTATTVPDVEQTSDESTGTVPGFGVVLALVALALAALVAARKR